MGSRLADLAKDIIDGFICRCFVADLPHADACPCGGDGRDDTGDPTWEGCWHCQAREALADEGPDTHAWLECPLARHLHAVNRGRSPLCGNCEPGSSDPRSIASRALATIRGAARAAETTKEAP